MIHQFIALIELPCYLDGSEYTWNDCFFLSHL